MEIIKLLSDGNERSVGDIASRISISLTATSKHVVLLRQVGFLERRQVGYEAHYRLDEPLPTEMALQIRLIRQSLR